MEIAKVTSKGQITIPRDIRAKMDLKKGDKILIFEPVLAHAIESKFPACA